MDKVIELLISRPFEPKAIRYTIYALFITLTSFCLFVIVFEATSGNTFLHKEGAAVPLLQTLIIGSSILAIIAFSQEWTSNEKYVKDLSITLTNLFQAFKYQDQNVYNRDLIRVFREIREIVKGADVAKAKEVLIDRAQEQLTALKRSNLASDKAELDHINFLITTDFHTDNQALATIASLFK